MEISGRMGTEYVLRYDAERRRRSFLASFPNTAGSVFLLRFFFLRLFLKGAVYGSSKKGPLTLHRNDLNRLSCRVCRIVYIYQKYQFDPVSIDMSKIKFWCKKATTSSVIKTLVFCTKIQFLTYLSMRSQAYFFHIHQFANPTR